MKLVVRSRTLFVQTSGQTDVTFRDSVKLLFDSFNKMLADSNHFDSQIIFLQHISSVYTDLLKILPPLDVAEFVALM